MLRSLKAVRALTIASSPQDALSVVRDIKNIEYTEVKADHVEVHKTSDTTGTYDVRGHFAGIPWHSSFMYALNDKGFHSTEVNPPASGPRIAGGFIVEPATAGGARVTHYEEYLLPRWAVPLKPLIAAYLNWSMGKELRDLREVIARYAAAARVAPEAPGTSARSA
jgi:hypothetical protein